MELLRADRPSGAISSQPPVKTWSVRRPPAPVASSGEDFELLEQVVAYYQETLKESRRRWATRRRGAALAGADRALPARPRQSNPGLPAAREEPRRRGRDTGRLQRLVILRESGHEHFNGSLVVPIFDAQGRVVEIYGRKLRDDLRPRTPRHLYLPGPHRAVWNRDGLGDEMIVCEALIDAMTFWAQGYRNVTAADGVEGFTEEHLQAFQVAEVRKVLIAYDADVAGDRAAVQLTAQGLDCYRVRFPKGRTPTASP